MSVKLNILDEPLPSNVRPIHRGSQVAPPIKLRSILDIAREVQHATWLLKPYVEQKCSILMYGDAGTFKSFIAMDWAMQIARTGSHVIYLSAEGRGMWKRARAWCLHNVPGQGWEQTLEEMPGFVALEVPLNLSDLETLATLQQAIDAMDLTPSFVIVDTLSRYSDGQAEDKNSEANGYLNQLDQAIRVKYGASILIVHHTGLADKQRARGAYSLTANTDANFRVERPDTAKYEVTVTSGRMKDCEAPAPFGLEAKIIALDESDETGNAITSLAIHYTGAVPLAPSRPTGKAQLQLLRELERLAALPNALGVWSVQSVREIARELGISKSTAFSASVALIQSQLLTPTVGGYRLRK